jgi:sulfur-carrier protein
MASVHLPTPLRSLTEGQSPVEAAGLTVAEVIDDLERQFPGLRERLVEGAKLRRGLAVFVNDQAPLGGLAAKVPEGASVYFAPAIAGGSFRSTRK